MHTFNTKNKIIIYGCALYKEYKNGIFKNKEKMNIKKL